MASSYIPGPAVLKTTRLQDHGLVFGSLVQIEDHGLQIGYNIFTRQHGKIIPLKTKRLTNYGLLESETRLFAPV